jgi:hypothetical protein
MLLTRDLVLGEEGGTTAETSSLDVAAPSIMKELTCGSRLEAGELHEGGTAASRRPEGDNDGFRGLGD